MFWSWPYTDAHKTISTSAYSQPEIIKIVFCYRALTSPPIRELAYDIKHKL
jgi:hypothetical protein